MAVWSSYALKNFARVKLNRFKLFPVKNVPQSAGHTQLIVRSSHDRIFEIDTTKFTFQKMKDLTFFFSLLMAIPIGIIYTYCNVFIGPAKLALIPEGYEPKHWEYHKDPITRFFAKYFFASPQERYERTLHNLFKLNEIGRIKKLHKEIKQKIMERQDHQAWYYVDPMAKYYRRSKEEHEEAKEIFGHIGPRVY